MLNFYVDVYELFLKIPLFKQYIQYLEFCVHGFYPRKDDLAKKKTMQLFAKTFGITLLICAFCIYLRNLRFYHVLMLFSFVFLLNGQMLKNIFLKEEHNVLKQLDHFIGCVIHYYHTNHSVEDAVVDAMEDAKEEFKPHIDLMIPTIQGEEENNQFFEEIILNKYLTTFLALCSITIKYGDSSPKGDSLYVKNLSELRNELHIEIIKREKLKYAFGSLFYLIVIPCLFLPIIEHWSIGNLGELKAYYDGMYGIVISLFVYFMTWICYSILSKLRDCFYYEKTSHYILERLENIKIIRTIMNTAMKLNYKYCFYINELINSLPEDLTVTQLLLKQVIGFVLTFLFSVLMIFYGIQVEFSMSFLVAFIISIGLGGIIGSLCFFCILIGLHIKKYLLKWSMEDEVMQFQTIVIMLSPMAQMDVETILLWLEQFSYIFKKELALCVDSLSYNEQKALARLKEKNCFGPFSRIVENLQVCDGVGIKIAFQEMYLERKFCLEQRKKDNEIAIGNRSTIGKIIAYIPFTLTLAGYLIIPFIYESISQFISYVTSIQNLI